MSITGFLSFKSILPIYLLLSVFLPGQAQGPEKDKPYADFTHFSQVFGREKHYRIYLPDGYENGNRRYPVIYFFHGWGGRHFKDDNALLEYELIGGLVDKYQVILVMWDGNIEESEPRPYNIGNHKDVKYSVQMKDYFPELVAYIDSSYRTVDDRNHRGIIGFSMGGIMSFFLAGKYPHMVCSAVNLAGSPEFFIGYPGNHTLYPLRYTFKNLMHVHTRQQSGDTDILVYLNEEVKKGAEWEGAPYEFYGFRGGHMVDKPGETTAFEMAMNFVVSKFSKNDFYPEKWSHYDLYENFDVWDYHVKSNKKVPGFIFLSDVGKNGLGFYTHKWLPDGPPIDTLVADIVTAPLYAAGKTYNLISWSAKNSKLTKSTVVADSTGRIVIKADGFGHEFGIYEESSKPDFIVTGYSLDDSARLMHTKRPVQLRLQLLNRGGEITESAELQIEISTADTSVRIQKSTLRYRVNPEQRLIDLPPFEIYSDKEPPAHGEPYQIKLNVNMALHDNMVPDEIIIPLLFDDVPVFNDISVDDGVQWREQIFGKGNGDEIANAGEQILLYQGEHRLRLFTNDPWVDYSSEQVIDHQIPAVWEDGFMISSLIKIKDDCPDGHIIEFTGYYETNTWNPIQRNLHWGKVFLMVRNFDESQMDL